MTVSSPPTSRPDVDEDAITDRPRRQEATDDQVVPEVVRPGEVASGSERENGQETQASREARMLQ